MTADSFLIACSTALALFLGSTASSATEVNQAKAQITILYDAFGKDPAMQKDWGYAALVECGGKRILFDTGNSPEVLEQNARAKHVDLSMLDFVVMSHRHGDHMGGLSYLLKVNPRVKIYAPKEGFGVYGGRFAKHLLPQGPLTPAGTAVLQRRTARNYALRIRLAGRELRTYRQEH